MTLVITYAKRIPMDTSKTFKNPTPYDIEYIVSDFHWWFATRRKLLKSLLSSINIPINSLTLDIGCGAGSNVKTLVSAGLYTIGIDKSMYALTLTRT